MPSVSVAVAARLTVAGAVNVAPLAGCVSETAGATSGFNVTILAIEGTPLASITNSM